MEDNNKTNIEENKTVTENTSLVPSPSALAPLTDFKDSTLVKIFSFGLNGFFSSAFIITNSKLLTMLGNKGSGASTLISPYQSVLLGGSVGFILSTGFEIGPLIGKGKFTKAGNTGKTAWVLSIILGTFTSAVMLSTRGIFPLLFEVDTALAAADFLSGASLGNIPMLLLLTNVQIAFQEGDWYIPPVAGFLLFCLATGLSYLLGFSAHLGPLGLGLGASIAQLLVAFATQLWFLREPYKKYALYRMSRIPKFKTKMLALLRSGWKLSLQRLTEWGNLMLIVTVIGIENNGALKAANPSLQYLNLLALSLQGVAQAAGMLIAFNIGARDKAIKAGNKIEAENWHRKNIRTLYRSNIAAGLVVSVVFITFYFARELLANFFLANDVDSKIQELSKTLIPITMFGLIPDAVRIISAGGLRGWKDIFYATMVSLLFMVVIGVPAGYGLGKLFSNESDAGSETAWMFHARNITMFFAAIVIVNRCRIRIESDAVTMTRQLNNKPIDQTSTSLLMNSRYQFLSPKTQSNKIPKKELQSPSSKKKEEVVYSSSDEGSLLHS